MLKNFVSEFVYFVYFVKKCFTVASPGDCLGLVPWHIDSSGLVRSSICNHPGTANGTWCE
jgi:hypothetical protein